MGLFEAIGIAGSGLTAERVRMDVTAENLANADTTKAAPAMAAKPAADATKAAPAKSDSMKADSMKADTSDKAAKPAKKKVKKTPKKKGAAADSMSPATGSAATPAKSDSMKAAPAKSDSMKAAPAKADTMKAAPAPADATAGQGGPGALSPRQLQVLRELEKGRSNKEIGHDLGISTATVKLHVQSILKTLRVKNRTQAARYARLEDLAT